MPANEDTTKQGWNLIRLFAVITAIISAIMGMILSIEQKDNGNILVYHKWAGVSLALIASALYQFHDWIVQKHNYGKIASLLTFTLLLFTGHWGATLTHGENYLTGPILSQQQKQVSPDEAIIFNDIIKPIFDEKCGSCHMRGNQKGGLSLEDSSSIALAGKSGSALVPGDLLKSLLMARIHLPMNNKKHMPIASKPQLTSDELALLEAWIKAGAPYEEKLVNIPSTDSLHILTLVYLKTQNNEEAEQTYDFDAVSAATLKKLNSNYLVVKPLGSESPALTVSFFGRAMYSGEKLKELSAIKEQIVHLNLSKMPVTDEQITSLTSFTNLEKLNLNYTNITDKSITALATMKNLRSISVAGTGITLQGLNSLISNKKIKEIFIWDSKVDMQEVLTLQQKNPSIKIETGFQGADTMVVTLNKPIFKTTPGFFKDSAKIEITHVVKGVELRYSTNGSDPDSCISDIYKEPITLHKHTTVQVKAYKKGWTSSEVEKAFYMKAGMKISNTQFLTPPDPKYQAGFETLLYDLDLGDAKDFSSKWLGYQKNDALMILDLGYERKVEEVIVNALYSLRAHVFPPTNITVWGSTDQKNWKLLDELQNETPKKFIRTDSYLQTLQFKPTTIRYIKLLGKHLKQLPAWHPEKGKPGWFFLNEVIVN